MSSYSQRHFPTIMKILLVMVILGLGFSGPRPAHAAFLPTCTPTADFVVSPDPSGLTLQAGASGLSTVTVTPTYGFSKPITFTTANVPTDLTVTLSTTSLDISAGPATFTATVKTSLTIAPGDYSFDMNATTSTILFHVSSIIVTVPTPELGITKSKDFFSILQGMSDTVTINLESLYSLPTSTVALTNTVSSSLSSPTPPTTILSPTPVNLSPGGTTTSTLTITTTTTTPATTPGEYSIKVSGTTTPGSVTNSTTVHVFVTTPTFSVLSEPSLLTMPAGSTAHSTINVTSILGFAGTVSLTEIVIPPLPGLSASLTPPLVILTAGSWSTSDLTIVVGASVIPGTYTILVTGTSGSMSSPWGVTVVVPGPPKPDFSISGSPDILTVPQTDTTSSSTITLASLNGLADTIGLSIDCTPDGLTAGIAPTSVTLVLGGTGTSTLTVSASSSTVPGNYTVTVLALGAIVSNFTTITVMVTGPDFSLTASPPIVYLTTGGTTTSTITATSKLGFSGSIKLETSISSVTGTGLTASLSKTTLNPSASLTDSATLTLTATSTGYYDVEIMGTSWPLIRSTDVFAAVTAPTPDFSLNPSPTTLTIVHGTSGTTTIGLSPVYGFTGSVTLSATGPTGITATPSPASISGTATATLTVSVASSVAPGSYTVDLTGTSSSLVRHATIDVTVTSTVPPPGFTVTANPATLTIQVGSSGTSTITITPSHGFTGTVTLSSSVSGPGPTASLSVSSITITGGPGTSTLTISVASGVLTGTYTITIQGASGMLSSTAQVQIIATSAPSTQPASSAPTILGLTPLLFYGIIGAIIVVVIGGITVVMRRKSP